MAKIALSIEYLQSGRLHFTTRVIEVETTPENPVILYRVLASVDGDTIVNVPFYVPFYDEWAEMPIDEDEE